MAELRARAWILDEDLEFPEQSLPWLQDRPNVGLCISGGGTRSMCAAIGYLRGLHQLGLLERVRYLGAVSGGAWASVPYAFWERGPADDAELLGPLLDPSQLTREVLEAEIPATELSACATQSFQRALFDDIVDERPGAAWIGAVGEVFLAPFGLYDPSRPRCVSLDATTRDQLLARQDSSESLCAEDFALLRAGRPFPVIQSTLMGPSAAGELRQVEPISLQFTPLYVGCPTALDVELSYHRGETLRRRIGGGLIEPFAFGGMGPLTISGELADYSLAELDDARDLAFMLGTTSTAYAAAIQKLPELEANSGRVPAASCWPRRTDDGLETELWEIGDGGLIDNYGLLPLLQRGIDTAIVLVNSKLPVDLDYVPGQESYKDHIDAYLPALFGVCEDQDGLALGRNQVFPTSELGELVAALQAAKRAGDPLVVVREHELLDNEWWRIRGGRKLRVAWVYLERVARFEAQLPAETARAIVDGHRKLRVGPCKRFPNYETIGANFGDLVRLTPYQVKLLTGLCSWMVLDQRELFESLLR